MADTTLPTPDDSVLHEPPSWLVTLVIAALAIAVAWGAFGSRLDAVETAVESHRLNSKVHTNVEMVEFRLSRIEAKLDRQAEFFGIVQANDSTTSRR